MRLKDGIRDKIGYIEKLRNIGTYLIIVVMGLILVIGLVTTQIHHGYVGIQYSLNSGLKYKILLTGCRLISPMVNVTQYPISRQQVYLSADSKEGITDNDSVLITTSDGKTVNVDLEFAYKFDIDNLGKTYNE